MGLNTIDLQPFLEGSISSAEQQALANSFKELSATWGFFYVKGYESMVPKELVDRVFDYVGFPLCSETLPELTVASTERALLLAAARGQGSPGIHQQQSKPWVPRPRS